MKVGSLRVGVALSGMPSLLQDIVLNILTRQPDFVVIEMEDSRERELVSAVEANELDVLVTSHAKAEPQNAICELLYACPRISVLDLEPDGRDGVLYSLKPEAVAYPALDPDELVGAILSATGALDAS